MLQVGNESQDIGNYAKNVFLSLEARDVNKALELPK